MAMAQAAAPGAGQRGAWLLFAPLARHADFDHDSA